MQIPCGRGSVLLRQRCDTLCTSGFMDDVTFGRSGPYVDACVAIPGGSLMSMNTLFTVWTVVICRLTAAGVNWCFRRTKYHQSATAAAAAAAVTGWLDHAWQRHGHSVVSVDRYVRQLFVGLLVHLSSAVRIRWSHDSELQSLWPLIWKSEQTQESLEIRNEYKKC